MQSLYCNTRSWSLMKYYISNLSTHWVHNHRFIIVFSKMKSRLTFGVFSVCRTLFWTYDLDNSTSALAMISYEDLNTPVYSQDIVSTDAKLTALYLNANGTFWNKDSNSFNQILKSGSKFRPKPSCPSRLILTDCNSELLCHGYHNPETRIILNII